MVGAGLAGLATAFHLLVSDSAWSQCTARHSQYSTSAELHSSHCHTVLHEHVALQRRGSVYFGNSTYHSSVSLTVAQLAQALAESCAQPNLTHPVPCVPPLQKQSSSHAPVHVTVYDAVGIGAGGSGAAAGLLHPFTPTGKVSCCCCRLNQPYPHNPQQPTCTRSLQNMRSNSCDLLLAVTCQTGHLRWCGGTQRLYKQPCVRLQPAGACATVHSCILLAVTHPPPSCDLTSGVRALQFVPSGMRSVVRAIHA